jgi:hypothetical protein
MLPVIILDILHIVIISAAATFTGRNDDPVTAHYELPNNIVDLFI